MIIIEIAYALPSVVSLPLGKDSATWSSCSSTDQAILVGYEWILMGYLGDSTRWASSVVVSKSCVPWNEMAARSRSSLLRCFQMMISWYLNRLYIHIYILHIPKRVSKFHEAHHSWKKTKPTCQRSCFISKILYIISDLVWCQRSIQRSWRRRAGGAAAHHHYHPHDHRLILIIRLLCCCTIESSPKKP